VMEAKKDTRRDGKGGSGVTTDPADPAMREAGLGPKIMVFIFSNSKNTNFDVTRCGFWGAKMV